MPMTGACINGNELIILRSSSTLLLCDWAWAHGEGVSIATAMSLDRGDLTLLIFISVVTISRVE